MQEYTNIDQRIHLICQVIAKVNRSLVAPEDDDSHTNLYFDSLANRIYGRWFTIGKEKFIVYFDVIKQTIALQNWDFKVIGNIPIVGKTMEEIEHTLEQALKTKDVRKTNIMKSLHFDIPEYSFAESKMEALSKKEIEEWMYFRSIANEACFTLVGHLQSESEIRIWPHHFDTAIYTEINKKVGIGFGWAMEDDMVGEPYYYFSVYGLKKHEINYSSRKSLSKGYWIVDDWKGAVLPKSKVEKQNLNTFIEETFKWVQSEIL